MSDKLTREEVLAFQTKLIEWTELVEEIANEIECIADNLDGHFNRISKAKIGGSTFGIIGSILSIVGFGLSFATFGASLGLTIAGGVIAGAGGITVGGSVATDAILSRIRKKSAEELIQKYNEKTKEWKEVWLSISMRLQNRAAEQFDLGIDEDMARAFPHWLNFWGDLFHGTGQAGLSVSWSIIYTTIKSSFRLVATLDDAALNGLKIGGGLFRTFGTAGARGLHIAGGVFSILVIPLDVYTMVKSSIDVHKKNPHKTSSAMRKMAETIKEECPTKEKIQSMIQETLNQL